MAKKLTQLQANLETLSTKTWTLIRSLDELTINPVTNKEQIEAELLMLIALKPEFGKLILDIQAVATYMSHIRALKGSVKSIIKTLTADTIDMSVTLHATALVVDALFNTPKVKVSNGQLCYKLS